METKELREQFLDFYKKHFDAEHKPSMLGVAQFVNVLAQAIYTCGDDAAEKELGKELVEAIKRCSKVKKRSCDVEITKFVKELELEF